MHGGKAPTDAGNGFFIQPTIIADVRSRDTIGQEEIFGPVCAVIKAQDFDDAHQDRQRHRVRPDRRGLLQEPREARERRDASSTSATST